MNQKRNGRISPILIKGMLNRQMHLNFEIESLQERIQRGILKVIYLSKIMFHITILLSECEIRNPGFFKCLSINQIYLNKNEEQDANVFIFEEDQQKNTDQKQPIQEILFKLCNTSQQLLVQSLGFNFKNQLFQQKNYVEAILDELFQYIFEEKKNNPQVKITDEKILIELYNIKIINKIYNQTISRVYIIEKPYFIDSPRNKIIVKWIHYSEQFQIDIYLHREIKLLEQVNDSDNCTKMFCYNNICDQQFIFMKYYDSTLEDLNNYIGKQQVNINDLLHLIKQMLLALKSLHSRKIIHRDLKPQNIMFEFLNENNNIQEMRCVLIDFDRSDKIHITQSLASMNGGGTQSYYEGTPDYQPPEGTQEKYDASYDIWQLGYVIQCTLLRDKNKKFSKEKDRPMDEQVYNNIFKSDHEKVQQRYPQFYNIIMKMMDYHPKNRPNLQYIEDEIQKIK